MVQLFRSAFSARSPSRHHPLHRHELEGLCDLPGTRTEPPPDGQVLAGRRTLVSLYTRSPRRRRLCSCGCGRACHPGQFSYGPAECPAWEACPCSGERSRCGRSVMGMPVDGGAETCGTTMQPAFGVAAASLLISCLPLHLIFCSGLRTGGHLQSEQTLRRQVDFVRVGGSFGASYPGSVRRGDACQPPAHISQRLWGRFSEEVCDQNPGCVWRGHPPSKMDLHRRRDSVCDEIVTNETIYFPLGIVCIITSIVYLPCVYIVLWKRRKRTPRREGGATCLRGGH